MIHYLLLCSCLTFSAFAIEEEDGKPLILSLYSKPYYIGKGSDRDRLEAQYGKEFPLNTIFFPIVFDNMREKFLPQEIAYKEKSFLKKDI